MPSVRPQLLSQQTIGGEHLAQGISQEGFGLAIGHCDESIVCFSRRGHLPKVLEGNITSGSNDLLKPLKIHIVEYAILRISHAASLPHIWSFVTTRRILFQSVYGDESDLRRA